MPRLPRHPALRALALAMSDRLAAEASKLHPDDRTSIVLCARQGGVLVNALPTHHLANCTLLWLHDFDYAVHLGIILQPALDLLVAADPALQPVRGMVAPRGTVRAVLLHGNASCGCLVPTGAHGDQVIRRLQEECGKPAARPRFRN